MKKILLLIFLPYLLVLGVMLYIFYGPAIINRYEALHWQDIDTLVPADTTVQIYQSKGWDVYSLRKTTMLIKIALKPAIDVAELPSYSKKVLFKESAGPDEIYFISIPIKSIEVVYARTMGDMTVYFSVASPSLFSGLYIMDKITGSCFYRGEKVTQSTSSSYAIPSKCYLMDFTFWGIMTLPLILMLFIFGLSGKKPSERHFIGDPVRFEESYIYYTFIKRFRRKGNFAYLALTASGHLRLFLFMRPIWTIDIRQEKSNLKIIGKTIIFQKEKEKLVFRTAKIREWQEALSSFEH